VEEVVRQAYLETYLTPKVHYSPEQMEECFADALRLIGNIKDEKEKDKLIDIFDKETYDFLATHQSELETAKMNEKLQEIYKDLVHQVKGNTTKETKKEEVKKQLPEILTEQQALEAFKELKFSSSDPLINLEALKKLPPIIKGFLASPNVPTETRKRYLNLDVRVEKLAPMQKKSVSKVITKYIDPNSSSIPPVKLIVIIGELLTYKPKKQPTASTQSNASNNVMKKE